MQLGPGPIGAHGGTENNGELKDPGGVEEAAECRVLRAGG